MHSKIPHTDKFRESLRDSIKPAFSRLNANLYNRITEDMRNLLWDICECDLFRVDYPYMALKIRGAEKFEVLLEINPGSASFTVDYMQPRKSFVDIFKYYGRPVPEELLELENFDMQLEYFYIAFDIFKRMSGDFMQLYRDYKLLSDAVLNPRFFTQPLMVYLQTVYGHDYKVKY